MDLIPETELKGINLRLADFYGKTEDKANFRLVWSNNEREKAFITETPEGLQLITPQLVIRPKYPFQKDRYILERLTVVPVFNQGELTEQISYEPIWTFELFNKTKTEKIYVRPIFGACKFVVETILEQVRVGGHYTKYEDSNDRVMEEREREYKEVMEILFGNESSITDALSVGEGVAYGQSSQVHSSRPMHKNPLGE